MISQIVNKLIDVVVNLKMFANGSNPNNKAITSSVPNRSKAIKNKKKGITDIKGVVTIPTDMQATEISHTRNVLLLTRPFFIVSIC